jgi:polar amino acid transport system permease protein
VLFLNTAAYSAEIFHGALQAIPRGDLEAADAYGLSGWARFRRVVWPTMLRLAWPAYTNEGDLLFHATTLVFFTGFPALQQRGDALYTPPTSPTRTFNPFVPYPILAGYFIPAHARHHRALLAGPRATSTAHMPGVAGPVARARSAHPLIPSQPRQR